MKPTTTTTDPQRFQLELRSIRDFTDAEFSTQLSLMTPKLRLVESRFRDKERNLTLRFKQ